MTISNHDNGIVSTVTAHGETGESWTRRLVIFCADTTREQRRRAVESWIMPEGSGRFGDVFHHHAGLYAKYDHGSEHSVMVFVQYGGYDV
jgi:hypothetical protein